MTSYEMDAIAKKIAQYQIEAIKNDDTLLDLVYPPKYLTAAEAAAYLNISIKTLYNNIKTIPHVKVGKNLAFKDRALVRYIERMKTAQE